MTKTAIPLYRNCGLCLAEKEGFSRPRRQPSPPRDDSRPRSEGKVFLLVARQNPFTEKILTAPPRRRRSGSNPPKSQKGTPKTGCLFVAEKEGFEPSRRLPGLHP